jgi:glycosyltransferase involved in cell wall biosynthesis
MATSYPLPNPRISIITCTCNSEKFLLRALDSIEHQTYKNIEHILNDSFSTDETLQIIKDYIARNKEKYSIKLIHTEPKGVGNALNVATHEATGDIIHYLHSDDYYLNEHSLEKVAEKFSGRPNLIWMTGNFLVEIRGKQITIPHTKLIRVNPKMALSLMNLISHENTFVRREAIQTYGGFNETKDDVVEYSLWLHMIREHDPLIVNDEYTAFIIHKGSTSTGNVFKFMKAIFRAFHTLTREKVFPFIGYYGDKKAYLQTALFFKRLFNINSIFVIK